MTTKPNAVIQAACISLLLTLLPGTAVPQEPKEAAGGSAQLKSEASMTPSAGVGEPQATAAKQEGAPTPAAEPLAPEAEKASEYTIKPGDTLWDIANTLFKDPFLWPFIWKANPSITNPDLIYAGNKLTVPSLAPIERAMQAPAGPSPVAEAVPAPAPEPKPQEGISAARPLQPKPPVPTQEEALTGGEKIIVPEEEAQPVTDKYSFLSAGFVNDAESTGTIVGPKEHVKDDHGI